MALWVLEAFLCRRYMMAAEPVRLPSCLYSHSQHHGHHCLYWQPWHRVRLGCLCAHPTAERTHGYIGCLTMTMTRPSVDLLYFKSKQQQQNPIIHIPCLPKSTVFTTAIDFVCLSFFFFLEKLLCSCKMIQAHCKDLVTSTHRPK